MNSTTRWGLPKPDEMRSIWRDGEQENKDTSHNGTLNMNRFSPFDISGILLNSLGVTTEILRKLRQFLSIWGNLRDKLRSLNCIFSPSVFWLVSLWHSVSVFSAVQDNMRRTWFFSHVATELSTLDCIVVWVSGSIIRVSFSPVGWKHVKIALRQMSNRCLPSPPFCFLCLTDSTAERVFFRVKQKQRWTCTSS